jgi:SAM-dependent methyltransferase
MSFEVSADAYRRFMGRFSEPLAIAFADLVDMRDGMTALDVGCGPGALTYVLVERSGADSVAAVDPSSSFVAVIRERFGDVDVREGVAEKLPWPDGQFDRAMAQLAVHFMSDAVGGLREMARVTRPGGIVAANVWDHFGRSGPLATFWSAARDLDPSVDDESGLPGVREGDLGRLFVEAGMEGAQSTALLVAVQYQSFDEWWEPFTLGVGPAGAHVAGMAPPEVDRLRHRCRESLPESPFTIAAKAWTTWWTKPQPG